MKCGEIIAQLVYCGYPQGYDVKFDDGSHVRLDTFTLSQKILNGSIKVTNAKLVKFGGEYSDNHILRGVGVRLKDLPKINLAESLLTL